MVGLYNRSVSNFLRNLQINAIGIIKKKKNKKNRPLPLYTILLTIEHSSIILGVRGTWG